MTHNVPHTEAVRVQAGSIETVYDTFGDASAPPMLLVMGLGEQMIAWDDEFCVQLAARGYWVIRYDNRDIGLATKFDEGGVPNILGLMQAQAQGQSVQVPYKLRDMADDAVGLLDALEIKSAHVVGVSMGGMIAQSVAIHYPQRVHTLTSIMSTTGDPGLPPPSQEAAALLVTPAPTDRAGYIENSVQSWHVLAGPTYPVGDDLIRKKAGQYFDRGLCPQGAMRQLAAVIASGSRKEALQAVNLPTLVIHGDADPLIPVEAGIDTANSIPGAELLVIQGMGHALPPVLCPQVIDAIARHAV
jgi:pimeloyl-ACP methyl ester carboxylesterase